MTPISGIICPTCGGPVPTPEVTMFSKREMRALSLIVSDARDPSTRPDEPLDVVGWGAVAGLTGHDLTEFVAKLRRGGIT